MTSSAGGPLNGPMNMPIFSMLRERMEMLSTRQKTLAENVANVSTPGYKPRDVDVTAFNEAMERGQSPTARRGVAMAVTQPGHIAAGSGTGRASVAVRSAPDSETTLDGNAVVVEEQMMKLAETRMEFETAVSLYRKGLSLIRLASKSPGG